MQWLHVDTRSGGTTRHHAKFIVRVRTEGAQSFNITQGVTGSRMQARMLVSWGAGRWCLNSESKLLSSTHLVLSNWQPRRGRGY